MLEFRRILLVFSIASLVGLATVTARADLATIPGPGGVTVTSDPIPPNTLWYNGNPDGLVSYINQNNSIAQQVLYNDFNVTGSGWNVQTVWSNNIFTAGPPSSTNATWEIRSDMPTGTLVASGDAPATLTPTGFTVNGSTEYMVQVSGLSVNLAPGTYWLAVYPDNTNGGEAGNDTTSGAGSVGSPGGNNGNLFALFSTPGFFGPFAIDTSAGVGGVGLTTPEPSTMVIAALSTFGILVYRRRTRARVTA